MNVKIQDRPALRVATVRHVGPYMGPYDGLGKVWGAPLGDWIPRNGLRVTGPGYELYHNMPGQVPKEQLRTEICVPVASRRS